MVAEMNVAQRGLSLGAIPAHNRRAILGTIHELGACSRKEVSVATGLDQATVTRAVAQLIDDEIVEEVGLVKGGRGRRSINLNFNRRRHRIVCVRLQRRNYSVGVYDLLGNTLDLANGATTRDQSPEAIFHEIASVVDRYLTTFRKKVVGIGIALPGPFLERDERVILMTESPGWPAFDLVRELRARYVGMPVHSSHDARAAALTVWRERGKALGSRVMLYISAGQGIGSALVVGGQVFRSNVGMASELGHTSIDLNGPRCKCGNRGCLELYTSRITLLRRIREAAGSHPNTSLTDRATLDDVIDAYRDRDALAVAEVEDVARYLAQGIINSINFVNPDLVIVGDEYTAFGEPFLAALERHVSSAILPGIYQNIRIELARIDGDLVLKGTFLDVLSQTFLSAPRQEPLERPDTASGQGLSKGGESGRTP